MWGDETKTATVTFDESFSTTPELKWDQFKTSNYHGVSVNVGSITKNSFKITCTGNGNSSQGNTFYIYWTAKGK